MNISHYCSDISQTGAGVVSLPNLAPLRTDIPNVMEKGEGRGSSSDIKSLQAIILEVHISVNSWSPKNMPAECHTPPSTRAEG